MIKDLIKECVVNSQLGVSDLVEYCDVTKEDVQNILNDGDYSIDVAGYVLQQEGQAYGRSDPTYRT